jgi:3-deoxy-7-phosphoheptulonate synthase
VPGRPRTAPTAADAADAIQVARRTLLGMTKMGQAAMETRGNDDCHVILRGGKQTNYAKADVVRPAALCSRPARAGDRRVARQQRQTAPAADQGRRRR